MHWQGKVNQFQKTTFSNPVKTVETRETVVWDFLGSSGYGKTVSKIEHARIWRHFNPTKKIYAFDPKGDIKKSGLLRPGFDIEIPIQMVDFGNELIKQNADQTFIHKNFLLILDDFRVLVTRDRIPDSFYKFLAFAREMNADVFLSAHSPQLIQPRLSTFITHHSIFFSGGSGGKFHPETDNYLCCEQARISINKYVRAYGKGQYPNFPHMVVERNNDRVIHNENIDKAKMLALHN